MRLRRGRRPGDLRVRLRPTQAVFVFPSDQGTGAGQRLLGAVARHFKGHGVNSMLLWVLAENRPARGFYESLGGEIVAEDGFELGGAWLLEVAYGWKDLDLLLASPESRSCHPR